MAMKLTMKTDPPTMTGRKNALVSICFIHCRPPNLVYRAAPLNPLTQANPEYTNMVMLIRVPLCS